MWEKKCDCTRYCFGNKIHITTYTKFQEHGCESTGIVKEHGELDGNQHTLSDALCIKWLTVIQRLLMPEIEFHTSMRIPRQLKFTTMLSWHRPTPDNTIRESIDWLWFKNISVRNRTWTKPVTNSWNKYNSQQQKMVDIPICDTSGMRNSWLCRTPANNLLGINRSTVILWRTLVKNSSVWNRIWTQQQ